MSIIRGSRDEAGEVEVLGPVVLAAYVAPGAAGAAAAVPATADSAPWAEATAVVAGAAAAGAGVGAAEVWDGKGSPTDFELFTLLATLQCAGAKPWPIHVHKVNVHSAAPDDLFRQHQPHAPGKGHGKDDTCYFYNHAPPITGIDKKGVEKRDRKVVGGGKWHPEKKCLPIHGADGSVVGNKRRFSYQGSASASVPTGWILFEVSPEKHEDGVDQMVLCTIHRSNRNHPETSMAASYGGAAIPSMELEPDEAEGDYGTASEDERLCSRSNGMSSPPQVRAAQMPAPAISPTSKSVVDAEEVPYREKAVQWIEEVANISTKLLLAADKAVSSAFKKAPEIDEFLDVTEVLLRIIDELRLDRSIITDSLEKLETLRRNLILAEHMNPETRAIIVSMGADMTDVIFSSYITETAKRAKQALNVLKEIGADVQMIEQSWASKAKHSVQLIHSILHEAGFLSKVEGMKNESPGPVNSSTGASSSGVKRKADRDAPPNKRQEPADTGRHQQLDKIEQMMFADDDEMPDGADVHLYQARFCAAIQLNVDDSPVQAEQQGLPEAADEVVETLPADGSSDELLEMYIGYGLLEMSFSDIQFPAPEFTSDDSALHVVAECQTTLCHRCTTEVLHDFDAWYSVNDGSLPECYPLTFWVQKV